MKTKKEKTISDKISELLTPKESEDPEGDATEAIVIESISDLEIKANASEIYKKNAPLLYKIDAKYKGKISSRKDDSEDDNISSETDNENSDDLEENGEECSEANDSEDAYSEKDVSDENDSNEANNESGDENENENENESSDQDNDDTEEQQLDIFNSSNNNSQKGFAVQNQLKMWETLLEIRISFQKTLLKANSLPTQGLFERLHDYSDSFAELVQTSQQSLTQLMNQLIDTQNILIQQYSETKSALKHGLYKKCNENAISVTGKRKLADINSDNKRVCLEFSHDKNFNLFNNYRNSVIKKWSDRTKITSAKNSKEWISDRSNVLDQIETILLNKTDLIKNSRKCKGGYTLFKSESDKNDDVPVSSSMEQDKIDGTDKGIHCNEIYDDTDFYHQMLRELIESKTNITSRLEATQNFEELQQLRKRMKKVVSTKSTKGRKVRYIVHKKMVNFMAPNPHASSWTEEAKNEIFSSLFESFPGNND